MSPVVTTRLFTKFCVQTDGIRIDASAEQAYSKFYPEQPFTLAEYATTSGVALRFENTGDHVCAPISAPANLAAWRLVYRDDAFQLVRPSRSEPVHIYPVAAYKSRCGVTHTDRVRISPVGGCRWMCKFCDIPFTLDYRLASRQELLDTVFEAAVDKLNPARHALISGGVPKPKDEQWFDDTVAYLAEHSPIPIDIMMPPRPDLGYPRFLRGLGINALSCNLEVYDRDRAHLITPVKSKKFTLDYFFSYIEAAVEVFGTGFVQSLMVVGETIERAAETMRGIQELVKLDCIPVISPFVPDPSTPFSNRPRPTWAEVDQVYRLTIEYCTAAGSHVLPGPRCVADTWNTHAIQLPRGIERYYGSGLYQDPVGFYVGPSEDLRVYRGHPRPKI